MKNNLFLKILCSIPLILLFLYFIPFLGICLLILRFLTYTESSKKNTAVILVVLGVFLLIPKILEKVLIIFNYDVNKILYLGDIVNSNIYNHGIIDFSKTLLIIGILYSIMNFIYSELLSKVSRGIQNYIKQDLKQGYEVRKENDMKMREKREIAKNTHVVYCPYCGSDNLLSEQTGTCKFCRRKIENKQ